MKLPTSLLLALRSLGAGLVVAATCLGAVLLLPPPGEVAAQANSGYATNWQGALTNTAVAVKTRSGVLGWMSCYNSNATVAFVQVFDATAPTLGTTAPKVSLSIGQGTTNLRLDANFLTAIRVAATGGASDASAPAAALNCSFGFL